MDTVVLVKKAVEQLVSQSGVIPYLSMGKVMRVEALVDDDTFARHVGVSMHILAEIFEVYGKASAALRDLIDWNWRLLRPLLMLGVEIKEKFSTGLELLVVKIGNGRDSSGFIFHLHRVVRDF